MKLVIQARDSDIANDGVENPESVHSIFLRNGTEMLFKKGGLASSCPRGIPEVLSSFWPLGPSYPLTSI